MKTASKLLSMLLLVAMCLSLMGGSAYATGLSSSVESGSSSNYVESGSSSGLGISVAAGGTTTTTSGTTSSEESATGESESASSTFGITPFRAPAATFPVQETGNDAKGAENVAAAKTMGITNMTFRNNVVEPESLTLSGNSIDLNGKTWTITDTKTLTISGSVTISNGTIVSSGNPIQLSSGTLTLNNVNVSRSGDAFSGSGNLVINNRVDLIFSSKLENRSGSNTTINSGKFSDAKDKIDPLVGSDSVASIDGVYTVVTGGVYVFQVGSEKFVDFNSALSAATPSGTISVIPKSTDIVINDPMTISGQNVRLVLNNQEVNGDVVVNSGTLTVTQGQLTGGVTVNGGNLVLDGSSLLTLGGVYLASGTSASISGNVVCNAVSAVGGSTLNISGGKVNGLIVDPGCNLSVTGGTFESHSGGYDGQNVRGGSFRAEPNSAWLAPGYEAKLSNGYYVVSQKASTNTVVPYPDASAAYVYDLASNSNPELYRFKVTSGATLNSVTLMINGTSYPVASELVDGICRVSSATFKNLPADKAIVRFTFSDGTVNEQNGIYIFPVVNADDLNWTTSSTKTPVYFLSPNGSFHGYSLLNEGGTKIRDLSLDEYSLTNAASGVKLTLNESLLKTLKGTFRIGFNYPDNYYIMDAFTAAGSGTGNGGSGSGGSGSGGSGSGGTVIPPSGDAAVWPVDSSEWYSGNGMYYFYVTPALQLVDGKTYDYYDVRIDDVLLGGDKFTYNGYQKFGIAASVMDSLSIGSHTLTVLTPAGYASCNFRIGATLRPVDTDKHVTGSSKNLQFVCSDAISRVWIGSNELTNLNYGDYWTLSSSGKTITLTAKLMNTQLVAGNTYTLYVQTANGDRPSCSFRILTTAQASASPQTGDESNLALWAAVLVLTGGAAVAILPRLKKHEN